MKIPLADVPNVPGYSERAIPDVPGCFKCPIPGMPMFVEGSIPGYVWSCVPTRV